MIIIKRVLLGLFGYLLFPYFIIIGCVDLSNEDGGSGEVVGVFIVTVFLGTSFFIIYVAITSIIHFFIKHKSYQLISMIDNLSFASIFLILNIFCLVRV